MLTEFNEWINEKVVENLHEPYTKMGRELNFRCPICGDSKKNSLKKRGYYSLDKCSYFCHNCGISMSGSKFLAHIAHFDPEDIKKEYIKSKYNGKFRKYTTNTVKSNDKSHIALFDSKNVIRPEWKSPLSDVARKYLDGRYVTKAPFLKNELYSFYDKNKNEYILIPWVLNGTESYFQLNDFEHHDKIGRKYIFPRNKDKLLFGLDNIDISIPYIIIVEGVYDSLFIPNCVCCGGKHLSDLQYKIIKSRFPRHTLVMGLDNDRPGLISTAKFISSGKANGFKFFKWFGKDTDVKDINDLVKKTGDVNIFSDPDYVSSLFVDSIMMKMYLIENKLWNVSENDKGSKKQGKIL